MRLRSSFTALFILLATGFLSACDSSEERAEKHFQSALSLLAEGDEERAIVEFRNALQLNGLHRKARAQFADLQRERGDVQAAVGQYLRLVEQYPDDFEGQKAIAEIYAENGNWAELVPFLKAANALRPGDPALKVLTVMSEYQTLVKDGTRQQVADVVLRAQRLSQETPDNVMLRQLMIDNYVRQSNFDLALAELDRTIEITPDDRRLYVVRLSVLSSLGDAFGIETQLKDMIDRFPDDNTSRTMLIRWYVSQSQVDEAENYMRVAAEAEAASIEDQVALVQFLSQLRGPVAALDELNTMIAAGNTDPLITSLRSGFEFDLGNRDLAIAQMRETLEGLEPSDVSRRVNVALSQMLASTGNAVGARALIEQVLEEDSSNVPALKIQAEYLINGDQAGDAILALRTALDQEPRDADILTLLARAYARDGNQDLVGEMLSLAMAASDAAPAETVRYANHLFQNENYGIAEGILVDSLRLAPNNPEILKALGSLYLRTQDWPRAGQVQATLARIGSDQAVQAANDLKTRILTGQRKTEENIQFLSELIDQGEAGFGAHMLIVRNYLNAGEVQKARDYAAQLTATSPNEPEIRFLQASVDLATGRLAAAETGYRQLIEEDDQRVQVWVALFRLLLASDRDTEAGALIDSAMAAVPNEPTLQWIKASLLETGGDVAGAIAVYEDMYAVDSNNLIIANNLASLLSTVDETPETLQRAAVIARRLRSSDVAPFQDTYGWIAYLQGDTSQAKKALEPAAANLRNDPLVQFHLAKVYLATDEPAGALAQFEKVLALTGAADSRDFVLEARQEINNLKASLNETVQE